MRYSIMTSSSVGRGKPVLLSSDLKSHACMQCGGLGMPRGRTVDDRLVRPKIQNS
jgi:hypothetical protein